MPRFYCDFPLTVGHMIDLPVETARHAIGALRLRTGDSVTLFNGDGSEYAGTLEQSGKNAAVSLNQRTAPVRESTLQITLVQGISSGERMDLTLQKSVELGVTAIQPLMMRRTVVRLTGEKTEKRMRHWRGVVIAACEQSGRNRVPPVAEMQDFNTWLSQMQRTLPAPRCYLLDPEAQTGLHELPTPDDPVLLLAGPEGGFDPAERQAALAAGCIALRLGPRILRTETAALAALSAMQALWGDFR